MEHLNDKIRPLMKKPVACFSLELSQVRSLFSRQNDIIPKQMHKEA